MLKNPGLYVHLPWCIKKCPYCDFNSHALGQEDRFASYTAAVLLDLEDQCERFEPNQLGSIFFGGGTPSLFDPLYISQIVDHAERLIGFNADIEITLEANPGTAEYFSFADYKNAGVNRVSLGVQSFNPRHLKRLGRIHGVEEAQNAIAKIQQSGIGQLNVDLMYGLPQQTVDMALADVARAIAAEPSHISHYNLTIEPNTYFAVHRPTLPVDDDCYEMQIQSQQRLAEAGYEQYEVSAYAKNSFQSKHNTNYWTFGDYLGVGAGAHGKISFGDHYVRTTKPRHPTQYLQTPQELAQTRVKATEQTFEFMLNRLRLNQPIHLSELKAHLPDRQDEVLARMDQAEARELLHRISPETWTVTPLGQRFLNDLQQIFLP